MGSLSAPSRLLPRLLESTRAGLSAHAPRARRRPGAGAAGGGRPGMLALLKAELSGQTSSIWRRGGLRRWGAPESKLQAPVERGWGQSGADSGVLCSCSK